MRNLLEKVKKAISSGRLIGHGDKILMAVSGGPDSVAMAHVLNELKRELMFDLFMGHLNHGARGKDSDEDAEFVLSLGKEMAIDTFVEKIDVEKERKRLKLSFQEAARNQRQLFLESLLNKLGADKIALGHTADDQVETVLINLFRGSGMKGLCGMEPVRKHYIRPLFDCYKSEIIQFLQSSNLKYREDKSNFKKEYLRNRIRLDLIPQLEREYNPRIKESLFETSFLIREEDSFLSALTEIEFKKIIRGQNHNEGRVELAGAEFMKFPPAIQRRLVRHAVQTVKGDLRKLSFSHVQEVIELITDGRSGKKISLPDNMEALFVNDVLSFYRIPNEESCIKNNDTAEEICLNMPGNTRIDQVPLTLKSQLFWQSEMGDLSASPNQAWLDLDKTGKFIYVRFFRPGDKFVPFGMTGSKKIKALFIDNKVPVHRRSRIPILTTPENDIIWVYGQRISNDYRVTPGTKRVLFIEGIAD